MAGTFQDRLVTELRLAGATTIDDANHVLADFLPASTNASVCHHSTQRPHIASWTRRYASTQPSA